MRCQIHTSLQELEWVHLSKRRAILYKALNERIDIPDTYCDHLYMAQSQTRQNNNFYSVLLEHTYNSYRDQFHPSKEHTSSSSPELTYLL